MSTQVEDKKEEKKSSMDPFMAELGASFDHAIELDGGSVKLKPMAPVDLKEPEPAAQATQTLGETVVEMQRVEAAGKEQEKEAEKGKAEEHRTPNIEHPTSKEEAKTEEVKATPEPAQDTQVKVKPRKAEPIATQQQAPPVVAVPEKKEASGETPKGTTGTVALPVVDDYEKGLSDGQREELDMARAAEKFLPEQYRGQPDKLIGFWKKEEEFVRTHPDFGPDSEEFKEFVERQQPAYRPGDRRRVERMQIKAEVTEAMRKELGEELAKETGGLKRRQYELEEKPVVAKTLEKFHTDLLSDLPQGVDESLAEVGKVLQEEGFAAAAAKFPVEAPIYESTVRTASEYLDLVHGLKPFNEQDGTHRWLVTFIDGQADIIRADAERRVQNGKEFLRPHEFAELAQKDAQAARKHWTFSEQQILDMLAWNAHMVATNRIKELEAAGYARKGRRQEEPAKAEDRENGKPAEDKKVEESNGTVSPRAGTTGVTGLANGKPNLSETGRFMELLVPGGGKFAA